MKFKNILCPIQFDKTSKRIIKELVRTYELECSKINVLHVVDCQHLFDYVGSDDALALNLKKEMLIKARSKLLSFENECLKKYKNINYSTFLREGDPATEIIKFAKDENIDIIVMPTHARVGIERFFLGSVTELVQRNASCPLLVIRHELLRP